MLLLLALFSFFCVAQKLFVEFPNSFVAYSIAIVDSPSEKTDAQTGPPRDFRFF